MTFRDDHPRHTFEEESNQRQSTDAICYLCEENVSSESSSSSSYHCDGCECNFHKDCLTITYPKCHEHTLTFIRRIINTFPCDVCGSDIDFEKMYGCLQCDFYVHRGCIYLPKVIKITRHAHHRLSQFFLTSDNIDNVCGICRGRVRVGYIGYCCIDNLKCNFFAHSDCIIRFNVWDGKDLEGELPEEEEEIVDSEVDLVPLLDIDGKTKRHFSHDHDLLLEDQELSEEKVCQACILPTNTRGKYLCCKQCDFALHETCASLPRKMDHGLHFHTVILHVDTMYTGNGFFTCSVCNQHSCGFMYKCDCGFKMDVKCASFVEPFHHTALRHPLYLGIDFKKPVYQCYNCCHSSRFATICTEYGIFFDFKCVNLPALVKYKFDDHPLTLFYDKDRNLKRSGWCCEICEKIIDLIGIFYTCHQCSTTLHVDCVLGKYPYLKCGHMIKVNGFDIQVSSKNGVSRLICRTCHSICQDKQVFSANNRECFCSIECIPSQSCTTQN